VLCIVIEEDVILLFLWFLSFSLGFYGKTGATSSDPCSRLPFPFVYLIIQDELIDFCDTQCELYGVFGCLPSLYLPPPLNNDNVADVLVWLRLVYVMERTV
jgi:hypothetical protein